MYLVDNFFKPTESDTNDILKKVFNNDEYIISPKCRFQDIIKKEQNEYLDNSKFNLYSSGHFDFVILRKLSMNKMTIPLFAVEFDGESHKDDDQIKKDIIKNSFCKSVDFPLLRINYSYLEEKDKVSLLEYILMCYIGSIKEVKGIMQNAFLNGIDDKALEQELDDSYITFGARNTYPGIYQIAQRIYDKYGIYSIYLHKALKCCNDSLYICSVNVKLASTWGLPFEITECECEVKTNNKQGEVIYDSNVSSTLFRAIPITYSAYKDVVEALENDNLDASSDENFIENICKYAKPNEFYTINITGVNFEYINFWYCHYKALKELEKWAENNLLST